VIAGYDPTFGSNFGMEPDDQGGDYTDYMAGGGGPLAMRGVASDEYGGGGGGGMFGPQPQPMQMPTLPRPKRYSAADYASAIAMDPEDKQALPFDQPKPRSERILDLLDAFTEFTANMVHDPQTAQVARERKEARSQQAQLAAMGVVKLRQEAAKKQARQEESAQKLFVSLAKGPQSAPTALAIANAFKMGINDPSTLSALMQAHQVAAQGDEVAAATQKQQDALQAKDEFENEPARVERERAQDVADVKAKEQAQLEAESTPEAIKARTAEEQRKANIQLGNQKAMADYNAELDAREDEEKPPANDPALAAFTKEVDKMRRPPKPQRGKSASTLDTKTGEWTTASDVVPESAEAKIERAAAAQKLIESQATQWSKGDKLTPERVAAILERSAPERRKSVWGLFMDKAETLARSKNKHDQARAEKLIDALAGYAPSRPGG